MSELAAVQRWLQDALLDGRGLEAVGDHLLPSARQSASERLAVMRRSYAARLLRCMDEQFPALRHALGPALFEAFAGEYLRACPSRSYTLHRLGDRFPAYLEQTRPDGELPDGEREDWIDFMVDLARFELALFSMFDAPGHEGRPYATLDTPDAALRLQPCLALFEARHAVGEYHHEVARGGAPAFTPARASAYAIVRTNYLTRTLPLQRAELQVLAAVQRGESIPTALAALARASGRPRDELERGWSDTTRPRLIAAGVFVPADAA